MIDNLSVGALILPTLRDQDWRYAFASAAAVKGWTYHDLDLSGPIGSVPGNVLAVTSNAVLLWASECVDKVVVTDGTCAALSAVEYALGPGQGRTQILDSTSARFIDAQYLTQQGASVLNGQLPELSLPHIGPIELSVPSPAASSGASNPLTHFDELPIRIGATADWSTSDFIYPHKREQSGGTPDMDLTGRPRTLVYGPYIHLPMGCWQITFDVDIAPDGPPAPLRFEWGYGDSYVGFSTFVSVPGQYQISLIKAWPETGAAQARILLTQGLFEGRMVFRGCKIARLPDDTPESIAN